MKHPLPLRNAALVLAGAVVLSLGVAAEAQAQSFRDMTSSHIYYKGIEALHAKDIILGNPDGTVRADAQVSRAELMTLILRTMQKDPLPCDMQPFSDVPLSQWYASVVCKAKDEGIVSGYPDGTFRPSQSVTLVEAAKIAVQALVPPSEIEAVRARLYGNKDIWYEVFLVVLSKRTSLPHTVFSQSQPLTRGEIAQMLYLLLDNPDNEKSMTYEEFSDLLYLDLGGGYRKHATGILYNIGGEIDGEDWATFEVLGDGVARDRYRTYMGRTGLIGGEPATSTCSDGWCWDEDQVFAHGESIPGADPTTFRVINTIYAKDANNVYSIRKDIPNHLIVGADPRTFEIVDFRYQRDAENVFFEGTLIPGAHGPSFRMLGNTGIDQRYVYNAEKILAGADPATFELLPFSPYAVDSRYAYYENPDNFAYEQIPQSHGASFELFGDFVYVDENEESYSSPEEASAAGAKSLSLVNTFGFAKDTARVYYDGREVLQADPASFRFMHCSFFRDNDQVWYKKTASNGRYVVLQSIAGVDLKTFTINLETCIAHDAKNDYPYGRFSY